MILFGAIADRLLAKARAEEATLVDPLAALRAEHDRIFAERRAARADRRRAGEAAAVAAKARRMPDPIVAMRAQLLGDAR